MFFIGFPGICNIHFTTDPHSNNIIPFTLEVWILYNEKIIPIPAPCLLLAFLSFISLIYKLNIDTYLYIIYAYNHIYNLNVVDIIIISNKLSVGSIKNNKKLKFLFYLWYSFSNALPFFRSKFMTHTIVFLSEKIFFYYFLQNRSICNKFQFLSEKAFNILYLYRLILQGTDSRLVGFFSLNALNITHCSFASIVSEEKLRVILIFAPL